MSKSYRILACSKPFLKRYFFRHFFEEPPLIEWARNIHICPTIYARGCKMIEPRLKLRSQSLVFGYWAKTGRYNFWWPIFSVGAWRLLLRMKQIPSWLIWVYGLRDAWYILRVWRILWLASLIPSWLVSCGSGMGLGRFGFGLHTDIISTYFSIEKKLLRGERRGRRSGELKVAPFYGPSYLAALVNA